MACKNIFRLPSKDDDQGQKEISKYIKHSQLEIATDQEILDSWSRMESRASSCNKAQLKTWSQAAGIDWSEKALLASPTLSKQNLLQPISQMIFMHGLASNGVLTWITFLLIQALPDYGEVDIWKQLHGFVTLWVHPKKGKVAVHRLFDTKASESHSEMIDISGVPTLVGILSQPPQNLCLSRRRDGAAAAWAKVATGKQCHPSASLLCIPACKCSI